MSFNPALSPPDPTWEDKNPPPELLTDEHRENSLDFLNWYLHSIWCEIGGKRFARWDNREIEISQEALYHEYKKDHHEV